jgi:iron complex outermembrane receptor protein
MRFSLELHRAGWGLLGLLAAFASVPAAAQSAPEEPLTTSEATEVVVTAPRQDIPLKDCPAATTVVDRDTIEKSASKTIGAEEALKLVPGVKVDNQADGERVHLSIRGQGLLTERGIRGIKILLDGLPLNDPTGFAPDLFDVDWATVDRVEVLRGPTSSLWGGSASGGIIAIETRDGKKDQGAVDAGFNLGSYGFMKYSAGTGGATGDMSYRVSASRMQGDGYRDHTAYQATNVYGKFRLDQGAGSHVTFVVAGTSFFNENAEGLNADQVHEDPRMANPDAIPFNERQITKRGTVGASGVLALGVDANLNYGLYYRHTLYDEAGNKSIQHRVFDTPGAYLELTSRFGPDSFRNNVSLGIDYDEQTIEEYKRNNLGGARDGLTIQADQGITQSGAGYYLFDRIELGPEWGVLLGIRTDRIKNRLEDHPWARCHDDVCGPAEDLSGDANFDKTTARFGLTWNPTKDLGFYASWGQGFIPPATEELANNPVHFGGFNEGLEPATSHGEDLGVRGAVAQTFAYDVSLFHLETDNDFGRYRVLPERPQETFYRNAGSSRRYGAETLLGWFPSDELSVQLAYTYSHFKYTKILNIEDVQYSGRWMPNSPEHQAYLDVQYAFPRGFFVGMSGELATRGYCEVSNTMWAGGYTLAHARAGYRWTGAGHQGEATLGVRNLTDKKYIAFTEPDPDGNSYQPAPGRELFGSFRIVFGKTSGS